MDYSLKLDGEPLARGSVILTPIDSPGAPPLIAYVMNTGRVRGEFSLSKERGPVPGRYRLEVRQDATRWVSNANDPVGTKMTQKMRSGGLTEEDRREWAEATRKRDLSPSIDRERIYPHKHPGDKDDMVVEIKPGEENRLDVEVFSK